MTREEAIEILNASDYFWLRPSKNEFDALNMAIDALEQEPIYCKDCKHWHEWENGTGFCHRSDIMWMGVDYDDFCSFAEQIESEE